MDNEIFSQKNKLRQVLFPLIEPYRQQLLEVGDGHQIYVEECGNPDGLAVMVVHGGPGGGSWRSPPAAPRPKKPVP